MPYRRLFPKLFTASDTLHILGGGAQAALSPSFDLLVWNMWKGRGRGWDNDFQALVQGKEVLILQESIFNSPFDPLFAGNDRFEWVMARSFIDSKTQACTGVKTGAVVKSLAQSFYASPDVEPLSRTPKMLLATSYPLAGTDKTLLVVNIHAINFVSIEKFARQMKQVVEAIGAHEGPVVLAGDFNTWNKARYNSLLTLADDMGLTEVKLTRKGNPAHLNKHLDHIFYKGLRLESAEVLMNIRSSDHFPITAKFTTL
jgi:endonuclease/exonuclease/phosphatase (EEP) superfamily protein YafD